METPELCIFTLRQLYEVCAVKINLHELLLENRHEAVR